MAVAVEVDVAAMVATGAEDGGRVGNQVLRRLIVARARKDRGAQARGEAEFERIVGSAETEVALARQRAVEEAANRMSEIVMDVVEQVIGREVDAEANRALIDEAVRALQADTSGGAAAGAALSQ